jgi:hypothetical protein
MEKMTIVMMVLALATQVGWSIHQMDVKSVFFNGVLKKEVYMTQPKIFELNE